MSTRVEATLLTAIVLACFTPLVVAVTVAWLERSPPLPPTPPHVIDLSDHLDEM